MFSVLARNLLTPGSLGARPGAAKALQSDVSLCATPYRSIMSLSAIQTNLKREIGKAGGTSRQIVWNSTYTTSRGGELEKFRCPGFKTREDEQKRRKASFLFEKAIEGYLCRSKISFYTENEIRDSGRLEGARGTPTPDFLFTQSVNMQVVLGTTTTVHHLNWVEAKLTYGSHRNSTKLKAQLGRYLDLYGNGAVIFGYGCTDAMKEDLQNRGVVALNCGKGMLELGRVKHCLAQLRQ